MKDDNRQGPMRLFPVFGRLNRAFRRILRLLARPARGDGGRGGIVVKPYRGFGSPAEIFLMGRVFRQESRGSAAGKRPLLRDIIDLLRRMIRRGVAHAVLEVRFSGTSQQVTTNARGHFQVHLRHQRQNPSERLWHPVRLELIRPTGGEPAVGKIFVPPQKARFVVISDIDDTVVFTGVANKLKMIWRLFMQKAQSRAAFPGVASFYRALHSGASGDEMNPMLYVSRGPWSIYEMLDEFFNFHGIPVGPILFLRDWSLAIYRPFPPRARGHKLALIQRMLSLYRDLPFILIGDSGQKDPEIYASVVRRHPGRVLAVYIRNIERDPMRDRAVEKLAGEIAEAGSILLLASDSFDMASHAAAHGFISPSALSEVLKEATLSPVREGRAEQSLPEA
jgi:phosphatidate phosphatase APP1